MFFCWIIPILLILEFALHVSGNRGLGGHHGQGHGQGHGWNHNGHNNHHGGGGGRHHGWGNGNYPYFSNGGGNYGWNPPPPPIIYPSNNGFGLEDPIKTPPPIIHTCPRPNFTDDIPQLIIEKCSETNSSEDRSCWDTSVGIPVGWTVLMTCTRANIRLKQPSTCSSNGEWTTKFPSNCDPLFSKFESLSGLGALQKVPLAVTLRPSVSTTLKPEDEDEDIFIVPRLRTHEKSCPMLKMQLSNNFIFSCFLHHQSPAETFDCIRTHSKVPSGSFAVLKCKPPFYNRDGNYSEWECQNGGWEGDFDQKLKCFYSKVPPSRKIRPHPVTIYTTTTMRSTPSRLTSPYGWIESSSTTTTTTTRRPFIKLTSKPPTTISTTTAKTVSDSNEQYDYYNYDEDKEKDQLRTSTQKSTALEKVAIFCPPLKPKSEGMILECVSKTKASPNKSEQVFVNGCDVPQIVGSEAKYSCKQYYESGAGGLASIYRKCKEDQTWSGSLESFACVPQCGRKNQVFVPLITSGTPAFKGEWPWHAALFQRDTNSAKTSSSWEYICGATLISKKALLTAAHCVTFQESSTLRNSSTFRLDLGRFLLNKVDDVIQTKEVESIHIHPSYSPFGYDSDIAIVILKESVGIGYFVRPICFPQSLNTAQEELMLDEESLGTVAGWGKTETEKVSNILHTAELKVVSQKECSAGTRGVGGGRLQIKSTTYCAAPNIKNGTGLEEKAFVNVCNGDSGGGMYFPQTTSDSAETRWYLQGIVSVGIGNEDNKCLPNKFSFFTRVGRYADWLIRVMSESDAL